jgi:hypothetical protein
VLVADPSEALMNLAFFTLDHATESVVASGGPLVPFAVLEIHGQRSLTRFAGDLEDGQRRARDEVRASDGASRAAVAWDGYLTTDAGRTDAVFVEASEEGDPESVVLAQRYVVSGRLRKKSEAVGNAALVKRGPPLF